MHTNAPDNRCTVINADGTFVRVRNLQWLLRHSYQVNRIVIVSLKEWVNGAHKNSNSGPAILTAHLNDGRSFVATFESLNVCSEWVHARTIHRRRFAHVVVEVK